MPLRRNGAWMFTLGSLLDGRTPRLPEAVALLDRDRPVTHAALADEAARLAAGLSSIGVGSGDRVALWLPNLPAWLATFFACGRLGATAVSVNTRFRSHEVQDIVGRAGCKAIVFWPGFRNIDFAGILAECDPAALGTLTHVVAYAEGDERVPDRVHERPVVPYRALAEREPQVMAQGVENFFCVQIARGEILRVAFAQTACHDQRRDP